MISTNFANSKNLFCQDGVQYRSNVGIEPSTRGHYVCHPTGKSFGILVRSPLFMFCFNILAPLSFIFYMSTNGCLHTLPTSIFRSTVCRWLVPISFPLTIQVLTIWEFERYCSNFFPLFLLD